MNGGENWFPKWHRNTSRLLFVYLPAFEKYRKKKEKKRKEKKQDTSRTIAHASGSVR